MKLRAGPDSDKLSVWVIWGKFPPCVTLRHRCQSETFNYAAIEAPVTNIGNIYIDTTYLVGKNEWLEVSISILSEIG